MVGTQREGAWLDNKKRLQDQLFIDPKVELSGFPKEPFTPFFRSNNFIQETMGRLFGYNPDEKKWYPIFVDTTGRLLTSPDETAGTQIFVKDRESIIVNAIVDQVVPAANIITHLGEDMQEFSKITILVSSTAAATVYVQFSDDDTNWYDWYDLSNNLIYWTLGNEKRAWSTTDHTKYIRILVHNTSSGNNTINVRLLGQV